MNSTSPSILNARPTRWTRASIVLIVVLTIALGLRVWGIWFGLPYIFHNDEGLEVLRALQLGSGEFDFERIGKGGYFYILFVEYGFFFVLLKIFGIVSSADDFALIFVRDPSAFFLIGRATTAVVGAITVFLVYRIGRFAYSTHAAVLAAGFLTVNVLHAKLSHFITVDVPMTCLATGALYFAIKISNDGRSRDYRCAALMAALAITTKIPAVLLIVPLLTAHWLYTKEYCGGIRQFLFSGLLWQSAAIFLGAYLLLTPGIIVNFGDFVSSMLGVFQSFGQGAADGAGAVSLGASETNRFAYYFSELAEGATIPVFLICISGMAYGLWKREKADIILIPFTLIVFAVMSIASDPHHFYPRYLLPIIPVMALVAGRFLDDMFAFIAEDRRTAASTVLFVAICVVPTISIANNNHRMSQPDTRAVAKQWFDANISGGSKVFIEGSRTRPTKGTIPLQNSAENIRASIDHFQVIEPGKAKFFELELRTLSGNTYDLVTVASTDLQDLQYYKNLGVQYLVLRSNAYAGSRRQTHWQEFVTNVRSDPHIELIKNFTPIADSTPGPFIEIYRVNDNSRGD